MQQPFELTELSIAQRAALRHVEDRARLESASARARLTTILENAQCASSMFEEAMRNIRTHARVACHFHPDRRGTKPITVAESLLADGHYRNQFETGLSSGSRTAFSGGARDQWERNLFGAAYHAIDVAADERPKYGALALIRHPDGPTPRFGSCYLVLRASVSRRTSFTFAGSEHERASERLGTIEHMDCVMAALLAEVENGATASVPWPPFSAPTLGIENLTVPRLLKYLCQELPSPWPTLDAVPAGRVLDSCIEAQTHGRIDLRRDVERLVMDPSFQGTPTGEVLNELGNRYGIPMQWHGGFQLPAEAVPNDFRGPQMPRLAQRIAVDGMLNAAVIGAAEATLYSQPASWLDWCSHEDALQYLKQIWHVVVRYGTPYRKPATDRQSPHG